MNTGRPRFSVCPGAGRALMKAVGARCLAPFQWNSLVQDHAFSGLLSPKTVRIGFREYLKRCIITLFPVASVCGFHSFDKFGTFKVNYI